ncbi:hypothetical protein [Virgibacillus sp. DJP39]|uniref:hypothetical protein n=1 Tax=Virgibacillus sp. DJP39 TaxID=3409790 RepID=UPI003BB65793
MLFACSPKTSPPEEQPTKEKTKENIVVTEDGRLTFKIVNTRESSQQQLDTIKKEIVKSYNIVTNSIKTDYVPAEKVNVHLLKGNGISTGYREDIKLYATDIDNYPILHEMSHTILGYGNNYDGSKGFFTQEGFATYLEDKHDKSKTLNLGLSNNKIMKYLISKNKNIPLYKLIDLGYDDTFFRPVINDQSDYLLRSMSYLHAGSFIAYLIDAYGLNKFEQIYNKADLNKKFQDVYGKPAEKLEAEWIAYIIENAGKLTEEDKEKTTNFDQLNSLLESIDSDLFERKQR